MFSRRQRSFDKNGFLNHMLNRCRSSTAGFLGGHSMRSFKQLLWDERGAMMTEYATVTGFVALVTLPALLYCGVALATSFAHVRDYVLYPFP